MIEEIKRVATVLMAVTWIIIAGSFIILFIETPKKLFKKIARSLKWELKRLRYKIAKF